jgi:hypothetical protein
VQFIRQGDIVGGNNSRFLQPNNRGSVKKMHRRFHTYQPAEMFVKRFQRFVPSVEGTPYDS